MGDAPTFVPNIPTKKLKKKKKKAKLLSEAIKESEEKAEKKPRKKLDKKAQQARQDKYRQQESGVFSELAAGRKGGGRGLGILPKAGGRISSSISTSSSTTKISSSSSSVPSGKQKKGKQFSAHDLGDVGAELEMEERSFGGDWVDHTEDRLKPILLPLESLRISSDTALIKEEENDVDAMAVDETVTSKEKLTTEKRPTCASHFLESKGELMLIQFPSSLPYSASRPTNSKDIKAEEGVSTTTTTTNNGMNPNHIPDPSVPVTLQDLPNGSLGTLRVHKSGKVVLVMGGYEFDMEEGTTPNFAQELTCIRDDSVTCIGSVNTRMAVLPSV
eukprot:m.2363 g.2363  ORF g.2363 m.2363 type:complete len:331 (-) comp1767_c0_seq1:91-1083(-)